MPPPPLAELFVTMTLVRVRAVPSLLMPPPKKPVLPLTVLLLRVIVPRLRIPLALLPLIVTPARARGAAP